MQVSKEQLKVQQSILFKLGYYRGKIDGLWGNDSIEAKKKFEASIDFIPGRPNNGLPFTDEPPYPIGITKVGEFLHHPCLDEEKNLAEAYLGEGLTAEEITAADAGDLADLIEVPSEKKSKK